MDNPWIPGHPTTLDESKPINQLNDDERRAFCAWYQLTWREPGFPEPPETPLSPEGFTTNTACAMGNRFPCSAAIPDLPTSYCIGNLSLSSCSAPVSELADCLLTVQDRCWPSPHGCPRYFEKPGCSGTLVNSVEPIAGGYGGANGLPDCSVRVQ
jgi:hypothetical protein